MPHFWLRLACHWLVILYESMSIFHTFGLIQTYSFTVNIFTFLIKPLSMCAIWMLRKDWCSFLFAENIYKAEQIGKYFFIELSWFFSSAYCFLCEAAEFEHVLTKTRILSDTFQKNINVMKVLNSFSVFSTDQEPKTDYCVTPKTTHWVLFEFSIWKSKALNEFFRKKLASKFFPAKISFSKIQMKILAGKNLLCKGTRSNFFRRIRIVLSELFSG
jgi:hypothetical protein